MYFPVWKLLVISAWYTVLYDYILKNTEVSKGMAHAQKYLKEQIDSPVQNKDISIAKLSYNALRITLHI